MNCESIQQLLLDLGLDEESRRRVALALAHVQECGACRGAMKDMDQLTALLNPGDADQSGEADQSDAPPSGGWGAFEARMQAAVASGRRPSRFSKAAAFGRGRAFVLPVFGSLAAAVLIGWAGFRIGRQGGVPGAAPHRAVRSDVVAAADNALAPADVAQKVRAFGEVNQVFDGRTRWLLLSAGTSDVGLAAQGTAPPDLTGQPAGAAVPTTGPAPESRPNQRLLLVRLHMARGGEVVSDADLLIVAGTTATVDVVTRHGVPLRYHVATSAEDLMRVAVRVEVPNAHSPGTNGTDGTNGTVAALAAGDASAASSVTAVLGTCLQLQPYRDENAGRLVTDRGAYDLKVAAVPSALPSALPDPRQDESKGKL